MIHRRVFASAKVCFFLLCCHYDLSVTGLFKRYGWILKEIKFRNRAGNIHTDRYRINRDHATTVYPKIHQKLSLCHEMTRQRHKVAGTVVGRWTSSQPKCSDRSAATSATRAWSRQQLPRRWWCWSTADHHATTTSAASTTTAASSWSSIRQQWQRRSGLSWRRRRDISQHASFRETSFRESGFPGNVRPVLHRSRDVGTCRCSVRPPNSSVDRHRRCSSVRRRDSSADNRRRSRSVRPFLAVSATSWSARGSSEAPEHIYRLNNHTISI